MRIVLAPDSFKGSLTSQQACAAMRNGVLKALPDAEIVSIPLSDGGEGLVECLVSAMAGTYVQDSVVDPLGQTVAAQYGVSTDGCTAVIEMAAASGLTLVPAEKRDPLVTTSYGTGQLIRSALRRGCNRIIIGLGGSATNDGGAGMLEALGVRFYDAEGKVVAASGGNLGQVARMDTSGLEPRVREIEMIAVTDVTNPLYGPTGASYVFGWQKGGTVDTIPVLDANMRRYAHVIAEQLHVEVGEVPGAGAAGGMGAALLAFCNAQLVSGIDFVLKEIQFHERIRDTNLVLTGEGRCDAQTLYGKTALGVARTAKQQGIPTIILAGSIGDGIDGLYGEGVQSIVSIIDRPMSMDEAIVHAKDLLTNATERLIRTVLALGSSTNIRI